jgi:hypothetical protein
MHILTGENDDSFSFCDIGILKRVDVDGVAFVKEDVGVVLIQLLDLRLMTS